MRKSRLPAGGTNIFQEIKARRKAAENEGVNIFDMSIGQPTGPALESARDACAQAVTRKNQNMHEYQDNGLLPYPEFAREFVQCHLRTDLPIIGHGNYVDFMPIPGIKPMLPLVPLACGAVDGGIRVRAMTSPGYKIPETWCGTYLYPKFEYEPLETNPENQFLFDPKKIDPDDHLVMMNYPHNPSGQICSRGYLEQVCQFCSERDIRLFNDAAYAILANGEHWTLADVALGFPDLSWAEAYSASKAGNFTGWRVGAIVGSPDFIGDIRTIKGNTDSGLFAPAAIGVLNAFRTDMPTIKSVSRLYADRIGILTQKLRLHWLSVQLTLD